MTIIPAIDIINGKCVRLTRGDYTKQKIYSTDPVAVAKTFEDAGLQRLHIVDLDGAKAGQIINLSVLEAIAKSTSLVIDFGGGIKTAEDVNGVMNAGAAIITIGSLAVKRPSLLEEWVLSFGADKFLVGADVLNGRIKISGWLEDGGIDIYSFIANMQAIGVNNIFCTDISKDGAMEGPAVELYRSILGKYPGLHLTASGGVSSKEDLVVLKEAGCAGVIIGKAIYEGAITPEELTNYNS